jgi:hypothetical protein
MTFHLQADVAVFIENKMPFQCSKTFSHLLRDSGTYVERKDIIGEWYQATKVSLDDLLEICVALYPPMWMDGHIHHQSH